MNLHEQKGLSLIEVVLAGSLLIGIVLAGYHLLGNSSRFTGEIEKRQRFRDLTEDIRFAFGIDALCKLHFPRDRIEEGTDAEVSVGIGETVRPGAALAEYGLAVKRFRWENVKRFPRETRKLLNAKGELLGDYQEEAVTADLRIEVSLGGTVRSVKPITVLKVISRKRTGVIEESICTSNHAPGAGSPDGSGLEVQAAMLQRLAKHLPQNGIAAGEHEKSAIRGNLPEEDNSVFSRWKKEREQDRREAAAKASQASASMTVSSSNGGPGLAGCEISDAKMIALAGRSRMLSGEKISLRLSGGKTMELQCDDGIIRRIND